jgi:hypothetical protein
VLAVYSGGNRCSIRSRSQVERKNIYCRLDDVPAGAGIGKSLLKAAMHQLNMSARAYHRILKLARTIADPSIPQGRPGGERRDSDGAFGGGDSVSATATDVTYTRQSEHC